MTDRPEPPPKGITTIPPEIGRIRPGNGAQNQPPGLNITVTFEEDMNASTLNQNTFSLWSGNEMAQATVTYAADTRTATLDPVDPLPGGRSFTAYLNGEKTAAGKVVDPFWWTFTTQ